MILNPSISQKLGRAIQNGNTRPFNVNSLIPSIRSLSLGLQAKRITTNVQKITSVPLTATTNQNSILTKPRTFGPFFTVSKTTLHNKTYSTTAEDQEVHGSQFVPSYKVEDPFQKKVELPVFSLKGTEQVSTIQLESRIFNVPVRKDIIHRVIVWQLAKRRQGTHKAKNRSEVSGGGRKPWKQKGTGRARIGSSRAPHWRGGGVVFPPTPRSHEFPLQRQVRALGLKMVLSSKLAEGKIVILDTLELESFKTKDFKKIFEEKGWTSALIVDGERVNNNLKLSARNLQEIELLPQLSLNVYSILKKDRLVFSKESVQLLQERLLNSTHQ